MSDSSIPKTPHSSEGCDGVDSGAHPNTKTDWTHQSAARVGASSKAETALYVSSSADEEEMANVCTEAKGQVANDEGEEGSRVKVVEGTKREGIEPR